MPDHVPTIRIKSVKLKRINPRTKKPDESLILDFEFRGHRFRPRVGPKNSAIQKVADRAAIMIQSLISEGKFEFIPKTLDLKQILSGQRDGEPKPVPGATPAGPVIPTFQEFVDEKYIPLHVNNLKSASRVRTILNHLVPAFGNKRLDEVTQMDLLAYQQRRLTEGVCRTTTQRELAITKHLFNKAMVWLRDEKQRPVLSYNPVIGIKFAKEPSRTRYLTDSEGENLEAACAPWLRALVIFLRGSGMRINEALGLKWENLDLKRGFAYLSESDTKTSEARPVAIGRRAREVLATLPRGLRTAAVFLDRNSEPLKYEQCRHGFSMACRKAGITNLRQHDLRHDLGSRLAMAGASDRVLGEVLGHKSPSMTRRYSHVAKQYLTKALDLLDDVKVDDDSFENRPDTQADTFASKAQK